MTELNEVLAQLDDVGKAQVLRYARSVAVAMAEGRSECRACHAALYVVPAAEHFCGSACKIEYSRAISLAARRMESERVRDYGRCPRCGRVLGYTWNGDLACHKKPGSRHWCR